MTKFIDLTGQRFGKLIILSKTEDCVYPNGKHEKVFLCNCDCGNKNNPILSKYLRNGDTKSCGCLVKENILKVQELNKKEYGESSFNKIYRAYLYGAKKRSLEFFLSQDEFKYLINQDCYYCGVKPNQIAKNKNSFGEYTYNGIDRINSNLGYMTTNCVPCCGRCNEAKMSETQSDFKSWIEKVYNHFVRGENNVV